MRKIIRFLTIITLCITTVIFSGIRSFAAGSYLETDDGLIYSVSDDGSYITIEGFSDSGLSVTIPDEIDGIRVVKISPRAFYNKEYLTSVTIGNCVEEIGEGAFSFCTSLKSVKLGSSLKAISDEMFRGCSSLRNATLPEGLEHIGQRAFAECTKLGKIYIPSSVNKIDDEAFMGCQNLIFDADDNMYSKAYAEAQHIALSYWESDSWMFVRTAILSVIILIVFVCITRFFVYIRKRTSGIQKENRRKIN